MNQVRKLATLLAGALVVILVVANSAAAMGLRSDVANMPATGLHLQQHLKAPSGGAKIVHTPNSPRITNASLTSLQILIAYSDVAAPTTLKNDLLAQPGVGAVDTFSASAGTPTLLQLENYQVVVAFSNTGYLDPITFGDNLADYLDAGGIVVALNFDWFGGSQSLQGRWLSGNYTPFQNPGTTLFSSGTLGTFDSTSPLMASVSSLNSFYRETLTAASGATVVASWNDGAPLIAYIGRAIGISAYVGDSPVNWSGDFALVIVNAGNWLDSTSLSIKAPSSVPAGTKVKIHGTLSSSNLSCEPTQPVMLHKGSSTIGPKLTSSSGAYSFATKIAKKTKVQVTYAGTASCGASSSPKKTIKVR